ncbi:MULTISPECIES: hypothetical protein [Sinorhizobium]|nr:MULTISPECIES: hypothetical protein [Sinorhizobium]
MQCWRAIPRQSGRSAFMSGILITLGNPKSVLFMCPFCPR